MKDAYELNENDFSGIENYANETQELWDKISKTRNKIFAHQDILTDKKRLEILKNTEYSKIGVIIQRLLTLENIYFQAFHNGNKPDFTYKDSRVEKQAKEEIFSLLTQLI